MNKRFLLILFAVVLAANIVGGLLKSQWLEYISKPLIIISLVGYFILQTSAVVAGVKRTVLVALSFSWAGDVLLMFQERNKTFFLLGLVMFLIAHIFYIVFFLQLRKREFLRNNAWLLLTAVIYYAALISFLSPYLADMKLPVMIYGIVISFMLMLAMHMPLLKDKIAGQRMLTGALLFVISDSILAINKFYQSFEPAAGLLIMLTYGLAQLFLAEGASRYINLGGKE